MEHKEIYDLLKTLNIPVAYNKFDDDKTLNPPFMAYREIKPDNFKADNITFYRPYSFEIELVTIKKDLQIEKSIEKLLTDNSIPYDKSDDIWDDSEKIYHIFYEI